MKNRFYRVLFLGFIGLIISTTNVEADTYKITDAYTGTPAFNGGPFIINDSFLTFCLERTEYFTPGSTYFGTTNLYADGGGIDKNLQSDNKDYLDPRTAWLYTQFLNNPGNYNELQRMALQLAIWRIEDEFGEETAFSGYTGYENLKNVNGTDVWQIADNFYNSAQSLTDSSIMVLNLYGNEQHTVKVQSQLIRVPEPSTLLLLGAGLLGLGLVVRQRKR